MYIVNPPEIVRELTRLSTYDRDATGRPLVPDDILERMKTVTSEQAWAVLDREKYFFQFEGNWFRTHPDKVLVGRAVTAMMVPTRPDLHDLIQETGLGEGRIGGQNSWVIDTLQPNDVMVVDQYGKVREGTFVGDNLSTSVQTRTQAGAVIDGGIRDYSGIKELPNAAFFCRGMDPTPIRNTTLVSINMPIRIGSATVMPGDIVLGTETGVTFIPPHLAEAVVNHAEDIQMRDTWGKAQLAEGAYTPGEIDVPNWREDIETAYQQWLTQQK